MTKIVIIDDLFADHPEWELELKQKIDPNIELEIISGPKGTAKSEYGSLGIISQKALERVLSSDQEGVHYIVDIGFDGGQGLREHPAIKPIIKKATLGIERGSPEDLEYEVLIRCEGDYRRKERSGEVEKSETRGEYLKKVESMCRSLRQFLRTGEPQVEPLTGTRVDEESAPLEGVLDVFVEKHLRLGYKGEVISKFRPPVDGRAGVLFRAYLQGKGIDVTTFTCDFGHGSEGMRMLRPLGIITDDDLLNMEDKYYRNRRGLVYFPEKEIAFNKEIDTYVELIHKIAEKGGK